MENVSYLCKELSKYIDTMSKIEEQKGQIKKISKSKPAVGDLKNKKVTYEEESIEIDYSTGEVFKKTNTVTAIVNGEPDFIKMYITDIKKIFSLEKNVSLVLYSILMRMGYDNKFIAVLEIKKQMSIDTGLSKETIDVAISKLKKIGILISISKATYLVDPNLFARGTWSSIKNLRLSIQYNPDGTRSINSNMMENMIEQNIRN